MNNLFFHNRRFLFFLPLLFLLLTFSGCGRKKEPLSQTAFYFDTVITVTLYDKQEESLLEECFVLADRYEKMFSKTVENSDIWNVNHSGVNPVKVNSETLTLLQSALSYARLSDGKIDPSIGPVTKLWDFSASSAAVLPSPQDLEQALSHVGYEKIIIQDDTVYLADPEAEIDLGFIAKGYIADRMKDYLISQGVESATINLGGNVLTIGTRPNGSPFRIGIQKPFAPSGTSSLVLPITDMSVVSSGIYERCFELNGTIYHHILDTRTGYPVQNNLFQVTIISPSSMDGDALSTTCFLLGMDKGMSLIESLEDTEAIFFTSDGEIHPSSGLTDIF